MVLCPGFEPSIARTGAAMAGDPGDTLTCRNLGEAPAGRRGTLPICAHPHADRVVPVATILADDAPQATLGVTGRAVNALDREGIDVDAVREDFLVVKALIGHVRRAASLSAPLAEAATAVEQIVDGALETIEARLAPAD